MQIKKAEVENFRKLKNVTIDLDDSVTPVSYTHLTLPTNRLL